MERYFGRWKRGAAQRPEIPREPPPDGPAHAHVPWPSQTLPWIAVSFHGPAFSAQREWAAADLQLDLLFGEDSDLYRRLVLEEQVVDALSADHAPSIDPGSPPSPRASRSRRTPSACGTRS